MEKLKEKVLEAIAISRQNFVGSDAKFAVSLGISASQYSRIKNGDIERVLSDANWITIARRLEVTLGNAPEWRTANTPVYQYIVAQLEVCQQESMSAMLCDLSDIGKTYAARSYCRTRKNAIYVDCSQVKSKQKLVRFIAKSFGLNNTGRYADVYDDLIFYVKTIQKPLIILDEAGDLSYEAFLEIKALWNATELACGYYMIGADGLKEKIQRAIDGKKVGYTEIFSRFGKRYGAVIPNGAEDASKVLSQSAEMIIKANNNSSESSKTILRRTFGDDRMPSLRRVYKELAKLKSEA